MIGFVKPSSRRSAIDPQTTSFELFSVFFFLLLPLMGGLLYY
jgi:hypothetical protein